MPIGLASIEEMLQRILLVITITFIRNGILNPVSILDANRLQVCGVGLSALVMYMRSLVKDLSDLSDCRCDKINTYPTIERRQAGGCAAIAILHSAKAEKRTVDLVKNMVLVSFENGFGSQAYWAFRGRLINRSAGKRMRQIPKSDSIVKSTETSVDGW